MTVLDFLFFFLSFYSFVLLCYIPFTDRLGRDKHKILRETALMCVVLSALPVVLSDVNYSEVAQAISVAFYFIFFFYHKRTVKDGTQKKLFTTFIAVHTLCLGTELEFAVMTLAGVFPLASPTVSPWFALFFPLRIALYVTVGFIMCRILGPRLREIKSGDMNVARTIIIKLCLTLCIR